MKKFLKKHSVLMVMIAFVMTGCVNNPYSYDEISEINNSVVRVEKGFLKENTYGYYYNGELINFGKCEKPSLLKRYECHSPDGVRVLTFSKNSSKSSRNNFASPRMTIDGVEHNLICRSDFSHGKYCILEKDAIEAQNDKV